VKKLYIFPEMTHTWTEWCTTCFSI